MHLLNGKTLKQLEVPFSEVSSIAYLSISFKELMRFVFFWFVLSVFYFLIFVFCFAVFLLYQDLEIPVLVMFPLTILDSFVDRMAA